MVRRIDAGELSGAIGKQVFAAMYASGKAPAALVKEMGLTQVSDIGALEKIIAEAMADNPGQVEQYRSGKDKVFGILVGQVMKASQGKANPGVVNE